MEIINIENHPLITYFIVFIGAIGIVTFIIPAIINTAKKKNLLDKPNKRKNHSHAIPNFGGLAIFFVFAFITTVLNVDYYFHNWNYVLAGTFILFLVGLKDDLVSISPKTKFMAQILAALIIVILADIRIKHFQGFMGIYGDFYFVSVIFTVIGITFVTNAYNLIDGVDGLAGSLFSLSFLFFGVVFAINGYEGMAVVSFVILGTIIGFLYYNYKPAKIFLGDNGSLVLGFLMSVLCIVLATNTSQVAGSGNFPLLDFNGRGIAVAFAVIVVPVLDTFRVFFTRIINKQSPFYPDRRHIHHILLEVGLNSRQISAGLVFVNIIFIGIATWMSYAGVNPTYTIMVIIGMSMGFMYVVRKVATRKSETVEVREEKVKEKKMRNETKSKTPVVSE